MANAEPIKLRIVAYKEGDAWAAQCLEYDIAAQAPDLKTLVRRMDDAICAEAEFTRENNGAPFAGIDAAPEHFAALFDSVELSLCPPELPAIALKSERDIRIAA
jgi:hypothetical protein